MNDVQADFDRLMDAVLEFEDAYYLHLADDKPVEDEVQTMINPLLVVFTELFIKHHMADATPSSDGRAGGDGAEVSDVA